MATEVTATATEARGNTKARAYLLTLNEKDRLEELIAGIASYKSCDYLAVGALEKAPTTGHEHYHIYVHFSTPIKLNLKKCAGANVQIAKGSLHQCLKYLTKDGDLTYERGERPHQGCKTIAQLKAMDPEDIPPQYYRIKRELDGKKRDLEIFRNMLNEIKEHKLRAPQVIYRTGGSGHGKTYGGYEYALQFYEPEDIGKITIHNGFFDILDETAKCQVIEEFREDQVSASEFLQLIDKYGYRANIKGGFVTLRPEMFIISCIKPPEEIYQDEANEQFIRRITKVIDLDAVDTDQTL